MADVISVGKAMHKARLEQKAAQAKLDAANEKVALIMNRSKTGRAAQVQHDMAFETRKKANKNVKTQETRFKKSALESAVELLKANDKLPEDERIDPKYILKDFHYGVTATPVQAYQINRSSGINLIDLVRYLVSHDKMDIVQFDHKALSDFLDEQKLQGETLPAQVTETWTARLTISGTDKWDEAEKNVVQDVTELDAIADFLT